MNNILTRKLNDEASALQARGINHLFLFGSQARGEATPNSDIDLFFDSKDSTLSLIDIIGLQQYLREKLLLPVDLVARSSLHPGLRVQIENEAIQIF
jgi:uncharacterized protein